MKPVIKSCQFKKGDCEKVSNYYIAIDEDSEILGLYFMWDPSAVYSYD